MPFAVWSSCSQWLSFYEFKRQASYQLTFIDVKQRQAFHMATSELLLQELPRIAVSHDLIMELLKQGETVAETLVQDSVAAVELRP
jgi:hypothetical protein